MSVRLELRGIEDVYRELRALPDELTSEAGDIVIGKAEQVAAEVRADYPVPTGNLARGVTVTGTTGRTRFGVSAQVKSTAPHAFIYERGTTAHRYDRGADRGRMPAAPRDQQMIPAAIRVRAQMIRDLVNLLRSIGFTVTSDAAGL